MGYSTDFDGQVTIKPPLNGHEAAYLRKFADSRRMTRRLGPYFADDTSDADVVNVNQQPPGQPGLNCDWEPSEDGTAIRWNGAEKFYDAAEWMEYLIGTFLRPGCVLQAELASPVPGRAYPDGVEHFTFDHVVDGVINAQGENAEDRWQLVVTGNAVTTRQAHFAFDDDAFLEDGEASCGPECTHGPGDDLAGTPFPGRPGYVTGKCGHAVAGSEWNAGFRNCERCGS
jgi:hypothetical protein